MKNRIQNLFIVVALAIWAGIYQAHAAVTFTVTPSAISNTYAGTITLQIGGLTDGQTVTVQKYLDTDRSNIVDSSALLAQQFQLTDGQASVFTNGATTVTNFYVPGDRDGAANGSITAVLYPSIDFQQEYIGTYLFVLYDGGTPITNSFIVTNFPFAQTIKGNVVSNSTAVTLPYSAVTIVQESESGHNVTPVAGIIASNSGAFSIALPAGTYTVFGYKPGYVAPFAIAPSVTLGAGATITTNISLTRATETISGQVVDATSNAGLGGLGIFIQASDRSDFAFAFTDTNGNYTASVTPYQWQIQPNGRSLVLKGYTQPNNSTEVDTTTGNVSGATVTFQQGTALFYGKVTDSSGNPLSGAAIASSDNNGNYYTDGYSYTNGQYTAVAVGGIDGDSWQVQYDGSGPTNYVYSQPAIDQNGGTNINAGQAIQVNFTGLLGTNIIIGNVQDSEGNPVAGLGVNANATINSVSYSAHADTDTNGNYSLNVPNGDWGVDVNCGDGGDGLQDIYTNGNAQCPGTQYTNINSAPGTVNFVVQLSGGQIFGHVLDNEGNPVAGVDVNANDGVGDNASAVTDITGYYSIFVGDGNWDVSVDCAELNALGYSCVPDDNVTISEDNAEADFTPQLSASGPVFPFQILYGFSASATNPDGLTTNSDGVSPQGGLVLSGNTLYGTAAYGGTNGAGTIFAISTSLTNFSVEHTFSAPQYNNNGILTNNDGGVPGGALILSSNILYGTASLGGLYGNGTVFKMTNNGASFNVLRSFSTTMTNAFGLSTNSDGVSPIVGLTTSSGKIFYGTAYLGGTNGNGVVFSIATNGSYAVLHTFSALGASIATNNDGAQPYGGLVLSGNTLYGTAAYGGVWGDGTVFAMNTNGTGFTVLYSFIGGNDGGDPEAGLVLSSNTLFGTTTGDGAGGYGTVFAVNTNGTAFSVLHGFTGGNDGGNPNCQLSLSSNILYGTAVNGGAGGYGTVFAINTNTLYLTVLYSFTDGNDGANPYAGLILSSNTLYGTTTSGGVGGDGTVFAVSTVALPSPPSLLAGALSNGQFQITVTGTANQSYTVQVATNLNAPNWVSLLVTNPPAGSFLFTDPHATNQERFYRVLMGE